MEWRNLNGYGSKYEVSEYGDVRNKKSGRILSTNYNAGFAQVTLCFLGHNANNSKHKLVAECFVDNPNEYKYIEFIDGDKSNIHFSNLRYIEKNVNSFAKKSKKVKMKDEKGKVIKVFENCSAAAAEVFCDRSSVARAAKHGHMALGYYWEYI